MRCACNDPILSDDSKRQALAPSREKSLADDIHSRHLNIDVNDRLLIWDIFLTTLSPRLSPNYNNPTGYIGEFEIIDDHRAQKIVIELNGRLNKCGVISPRFDVAVNEIEQWIVNLLPSRQFGQIILSTTYGIMTHEEARRKKTGGKVLGFFY